MTLSVCDRVAERVALGEPLDDLAEHAAGCAGCQGLIAVSSQLGATRHAVDPGLGFSARMTVGAQHRLAVRRRRRLAAGLAATVATGALGLLFVAHTPAESPRGPVATPMPPAPTMQRDVEREAPPVTDADLAELVQLADVDRSSHLSANWKTIKKPLAAYKKLLKGVTP
jgi:hypothetical protein